MEPAGFTHLHVHTQYSLLDGLASISDLVDKAIADGMRGMAITDHGDMYGIKEFFNYVQRRNSEGKDLAKKLRQAQEAGDQAKAESLEADLKKVEARGHFKPIFGCEVYVARNSLRDRGDASDKGYHLIVLAKNKRGYNNLIKIVSQAWTEGMYYHPRTDRQALKDHSEGLIVCSACIAGEVPSLIRAGRLKEAEEAARWYKDVFGDDYYIELQRHKADVVNANHETYELQHEIEGPLIDIAHRLDIKMVASNDVHFVNREDGDAHELLVCLSTNKYLSDQNRMLYTKQEWFKTTAEMQKVFPDMPELLANTMEVLDKVEEYDIDHGPIMPNFDIPQEFGTEAQYRSRLTEQQLYDEFTQDEHGNVVLTPEEGAKKIAKLGGYDKLYRIKFEADYLKKLAYEGAKRRYGDPLPPDIDERINFELHIMKTMGFPGYFLIVQDFITVAREKLGVSVGPGRGSAAGSCVAYCLGITQIDPVKYDLLFERFLNPDRISLPDIDVDFDDDGRALVLQYVTEKYGAEKVAHIITYGAMAAKSAIKDVGRVLQLPLAESNRLAKLVPDRMPTDPKKGKPYATTLSNCYRYVPEFKPELASQDRLLQETLKFAQRLDGTVRNVGVHACGVIICRDDVTDWVPVSTALDKNDGRLLVTQYEGKVIEETGLIKMDFLGLKTLSIIKEAVANIRQSRGIDLDVDAIPIDDPATFRLYCEGRTKATFQFESPGMQKSLRELQPSTFEDLIAMNALYRPGPMDYIPNFIARKHGQAPIEYPIPAMEKYLKDTYGITVYQEQVMLLSRLLANFTRGESDTLRKAMGKKQIEKMNHLKGEFMTRGKANGHDPKVLESIWKDWEKFASYAFNKSHATCYSWVAYQTAYLKANYPAEYMAAVLSRNLSDISKISVYMDECRSMKLAVKGPDINASYGKFAVDAQGNIRFGLSAIKGVGVNVVDALLKERQQNGPFASVYDLVERVPAGIINRRVLEALAMAGALDSVSEIAREDYQAKNAKGEAFSELLLRYGQQFQNAKQETAASLFGDDDWGEMDTSTRPVPVPGERWSDVARLDAERDLVGMYLSAHPLDPYYMELNYGCTHTLKDLEEAVPREGAQVTFGGLVVKFVTKQSRRGTNFGVLTVEDFTGTHEEALFGQDYIDYNRYGIPGTPVLISAAWKRRYNSDELRLSITGIQLLENVQGKLLDGITIDASLGQLSQPLMEHLADARVTNGGGVPVTLRVTDPEVQRSVAVTTEGRYRLDRNLLNALDDMDLAYKVHRR